MNKIEPLDQNGLTDANASNHSPKLQNKIDSHGSILERLMDFAASIPDLLSTGKYKIIDLSEEYTYGRGKIEFLAWSAVDFVLDIADECIGQG